jgi:hypothetical protein
MDRSHRARHLVDAWLAAVSEAFEFAAEDGAAPPSSDIWAFALMALLKDCDKVSIPQINPLQLGGVCAEWHELGMNIEIRFRGVDDVYVVIEDAKGEIDSFYGRDPHLKSAATALLHLARRAL